MRPSRLYDPEGIDGGFEPKRAGLLRYLLTVARMPRLRDKLALDMGARLQQGFPKYKVTTHRGEEQQMVIDVTSPDWVFAVDVRADSMRQRRTASINYVTGDLACGLELLDPATPRLDAGQESLAQLLSLHIVQHAAAWPLLTRMSTSLKELGYSPSPVTDSMMDIKVDTKSFPGWKGNVRLRYQKSKRTGEESLSANVTGLAADEEVFWTQLASLSPKEAVEQLESLVRQDPKKNLAGVESIPMETSLDLI